MPIPPIFDSLSHLESRVIIKDSCNCNSRCCIPWWSRREPVELPALTYAEIDAIAQREFNRAIRLDIGDHHGTVRKSHS